MPRHEAPRALVLRHHDEDDPGLVGAALASRGYEVATERIDGSTSTVDIGGVALMVVLGSKWSVYDDDAVGAWIDVELAAVRAADRAGIGVLGVCFGAQVLCTAFGGRVEPAPRAEIGWVQLDGAPGDGVPAGAWFQFHADQCLVPPIATVLDRNEVCVQAFRIGRHLGVQFHPELDAGQLERWMGAGGAPPVRAFGLDPDELVAETAAREHEVRPRVDALVEGFVRRAVG